MLRNNFSIQLVAGKILISSTEPIERVANIIGLSAKYIAATIKYEGEMSSEMEAFKQEELSFIEFSKRAMQIKSNVCNGVDFDNFSNCLLEHMSNRRLYPRQLLSAYHLAFSQNACNFSVPGAGKTSIVYGAYTYLRNLPESDQKRVDRILVVCPLSAFAPWESEYEECYGRKPKSKRINGQISSEDKKQYFYGDTDELILISYASIISVKEQILYFLKNNRVMVVLDEAHKIKNTAGGITAESLKAISPFCTSRVVLTGTPAPNGYEDMYNLFKFIWPKKNVTNYTVGQLRDMTKRGREDDRVAQLMTNIDPFYIRINKSDLGIPPAIENPPIKVKMSDSQRRIYDFIERKFVEATESGDAGLHSMLTRARMLRLRQVASNPALLQQPISEFANELGENYSIVESSDNELIKDIVEYYHDEVPSKFVRCGDLINELIGKGEKVIVWAIFIKTIEKLSHYLETRGIPCKYLYGATPVATDGMTEDDAGYEFTREAIIREFHKKNSPFKVIVANPYAVAESISLHKACHNAIYLERSFDCARFVQSKDRIHRYGLKAEVKTNYYYLLSEQSVDEVIDERLHVKEKRMLSLIESMPIPLFNNLGDDGDDDIKAIIAHYVGRKDRKIQ